MIQVIVNEYPPLYDKIAAAFGLQADKTIIFSWGDRLYNPYRLVIPPQLIAHEAVHGGRQGSGQKIVDWWKRYIEDRAFRLAEEVPAHQAEYEHMLKNGNRKERRAALRTTAARLADPLYGGLIMPSTAIALLRKNERAGYV